MNMTKNCEKSQLRACWHEGGGPQVGEVTCGGIPHLTCKRDRIKMRDCMDRRVTPPKRVTSPIWGPPPPCKQALTRKIVRLAIFRNTRKIAIFSATCEPGHKWDSNPWPLWCRCSAPVRKSAVSQRSRIRIPYKPEFFLGFLFAAAKVAYMTCDDLPSFNSSLRSSHNYMIFIYS